MSLINSGIEAVLFDLDGTLLDTQEGILASARHVIDIMHLPELPTDILLKFVGPPIQYSLQKYCGLNEEQAQQGANLFRSYYKSKALYLATVCDGIFDLLKSLKGKGIKIGVATYKREDYAIDLLRNSGIACYCDVIHGADNENQLTKVDIVDMCINEMGCDRSATILVGDTDHDAIGAEKAGIGFVAVTWGFGYTDESQLDYPYIKIIHTANEF